MRRRHEGLTINCRLFGVTVGRSSKSDDLRSNKDNSRLFRASRLQWHVLAPEFPQLSIYGRPSISEIETDLMSCSRFHFTFSSYLDVHGLVFETSICYWQDQPDSRFHGRTPASGPVYVRSPVRRRRCGTPKRHPRSTCSRAIIFSECDDGHISVRTRVRLSAVTGGRLPRAAARL